MDERKWNNIKQGTDKKKEKNDKSFHSRGYAYGTNKHLSSFLNARCDDNETMWFGMEFQTQIKNEE